LSQAKLAELVGRSPSTIRAWERDKSAPTEKAVLHALAAILGVDERFLFEKAGQEPPPEIETSPTVEEALATLRPELVEPSSGSIPDAEELEEEEESVEGDSSDVDMMEDVPDVSAEPEVEQAPAAVETPDRGDDSSPTQPETTLRQSQARRPYAEPGYVAPPEPYVITSPTPPVAEPSYMEDTGQRQLYRVRNLATLVVVIALIIAFLWALSEGLDAIGSWWDDFFGSLRL
jgi:transcriptional regulator with XRE-family HTH domain